MYSSVSCVLSNSAFEIESPVGLYCLSVNSAGSIKSVVVSVIHASVQLTSSSSSLSTGIGSSGGVGGSVVLQLAVQSKSKKKTIELINNFWEITIFFSSDNYFIITNIIPVHSV